MAATPGAILRVHLRADGLRAGQTPHPDPDGFPGGRALAVLETLPFAALPATHPDAPFCLFGGPLSGVAAPLCGRAVAAALSPLTDTFFDAQIGGRAAFELAKSGLTGLVLTGRAAVPSGLHIEDGQARLVPCPAAPELTATRLATHLAQGSPHPGALVCVGPAAWSGSPLAGLVYGPVAGVTRGGLGLVLAAKNIAYLAIRGTGRVPVADPAGFSSARADIMRLVAASPALAGAHGIGRFGTAALLDLTDARSMTPTANFQKTRFAAHKSVNAPALSRLFAPRRVGCRACHLRCGRVAGDGRPLPELDALSHFTALLENPCPHTALAANALCLDLGLDPVSTASALACRAEITGRSPDAPALPSLIADMAHGRGPGRETACGPAAFAARSGRPGAAMAVKGLPLPAFDPRGGYGLALSFAVSTRGGCHLRALAIGHELLRKPVATDRFDFAGKARIIVQSENALAAMDSLVACPWLALAASLEELAAAVSAVTGRPATPAGLARAGARTVYAERLINARRAAGPAPDDLPPRFFADPGTPGEDFAVPPLDRTAFLAARAAYYRIRGLSPQGLPLPETAGELGLPWTA